MMSVWKDDYKQYLTVMKEKNVAKDISTTQRSFSDTILSTVLYQQNATKNDNPFPVIATRKNIRKCKIELVPGTEAYIGDVFYIYDEYWLCVDMYKDEYGMFHGEAWLCNQVFKFTDKNGRILKVYGVLDDGTYSDQKDSKIPVERSNHVCYVPKSWSTKSLHIDKRMAIGVIENERGEKILEVGVISWIDTHSRNIGRGSHLITFGITSGVFDKDIDSTSEIVCDYYCSNKKNVAKYTSANIEGNLRVRIGTTRTYRIKANDTPITDGLSWSVSGDATNNIDCIQSNGEFSIQVPLDENLVGQTINISCYIAEMDITCTREVEVIAYG